MEIFVAVNGKDTNSGTYSSPFATVEKALETAAGHDEPVTINICGGTYKLAGTVDLNEKHSNLTVRAYKNEKVIITASDNYEIPYSAFKKVTDEKFLSKLMDPAAKDKVLYVDLKEFGVKDYGQLRMNGFGVPNSGFAPMLSLGDNALKFAKYPKNDYIYTKDILKNIDAGDVIVPGTKTPAIEYTLSDDRWKNWDTDNDDIWCTAYFGYDWAETIAPAKFNRETEVITGLSIHEAQQNRRLYYFNIPEEISLPGEYYLNRKTGILYVIPPENVVESDMLTFCTSNIVFFDIHDTNNITFEGIKFTGTGADLMNIKHCTNIVIDKCELSLSGEEAVKFVDCYSSGIRNSYLHDFAAHGIMMRDCGNRKNLTPGNCFVYNTKIRSHALYRKSYANGITLAEDVGTTISHCEIFDSASDAIFYIGNDVTIEYCNVYDVCKETADAGAIYTGRHWETRGNVIRYNYIHDMMVIDSPTSMPTIAVYLDDMHSSTKVYGNIFYNVHQATLIGGGRYNEAVNNIVINCRRSIETDCRGTWWAKHQWDQLHGALVYFDYKNGIWNEKYPELASILDDEPMTPKYNTVSKNVFINSPDPYIEEKFFEKYSKCLDYNVQLEDPDKLFADYANHDFTIVNAEEILSKVPGFEILNFNEMGLIKE